MYDDKSALEQMHYALLLQIMRHNGLGDILDRPHSGVRVRKLLSAVVLATDMSVHFDFMKNFTLLVRGTEYNLVDRTTLLCQALIKCADISNPVSFNYCYRTEPFFQHTICRVDHTVYHSTGLVPCPKNGHPKYT